MTPGVGAADPVALFEQRLDEHRSAKRWLSLAWWAAFTLAFAASVVVGEVDLVRLAEGLPNIAAYFGRIMPVLRLETLWADIGEWLWGIDLWLILLGDTVLMALVGTFAGAIIGLCLCFDASSTITRSRVGFFAARRMLDILRSVPELVFALIFVFAFGPGPFAGVLAITLHTGGALGKLFAEANENADQRPMQAIAAAGGTWLHMVRFAVIPQVLPNHLSYALLRFEINVRSASVLGLVGAGGIGEELYLVVRQFIYSDISAIVGLILVTVALVDIGCEKLRMVFIEPAARPSSGRSLA